MNRPTVFLTGGTGTLGKLIYDRLAREQVKIIALFRNRRLEQVRAGTESVQGDVGEKYFGWSKEKYLETAHRVNIILHAAASTRFDLTIDVARMSNVETVRSMIEFGRACPNLRRLGHVSTAFVAGKRTGVIWESELRHYQGFVSTYEQSKYEAEMLIRKEKGDLPMAVFRPSLVDSAKALAWSLELIKKRWLPVLPGNAHDRLDIIDGEVAADRIIRLILAPDVSQETFHICQGEDSPTLAQIAGGGQTSFCGDILTYETRVKEAVRQNPELQRVYAKANSFLPQLAYPKIFDNSHTRRDLQL